MSALKGLQEKIRKLELERADAEDNLKKLAAESRHYKDVLQKELTVRESSQGVISKQNKRRLQLYLTSSICTSEYLRSVLKVADWFFSWHFNVCGQSLRHRGYKSMRKKWEFMTRNDRTRKCGNWIILKEKKINFGPPRFHATNIQSSWKFANQKQLYRTDLPHKFQKALIKLFLRKIKTSVSVLQLNHLCVCCYIF